MHIATSFGTYRIGGGPVYRGLSEVKLGGKVSYRPRKTARGGGRRNGVKSNG